MSAQYGSTDAQNLLTASFFGKRGKSKGESAEKSNSWAFVYRITDRSYMSSLHIPIKYQYNLFYCFKKVL